MIDVKNRIKQKLADIETLSINTYGTSPFQGQIDNVNELLATDEFRIAVVGEFSAGKSTFINALIGYDLLPHARSETTATITHIHNVMQDDQRCGKVVINFTDQREPKTLDISTDKSALKEYVTSFSEQFSVIDDIDQVHVYTHFLNLKTPVVLVDTPGLNGTADGHRSLTLNEVERAHASIFLFHLRALTETDLDFLKLLSKHQSHIFYVLNHIDSINELEGETVEKVLKDFDNQISTHFSDKYFAGDKAETFGVSALQALVYKDTSFKKLYEGDFNDLTEAKRNLLWDSSRFGGFEQTMQKYIEYHSEHDVIGVALKGVNSVINDLEDNLSQEIACFEQQSQGGNDGRVSRYLETLDERKQKSWKTIENYLQSRGKVLEKHTVDYLKESLNKLSEQIQLHINQSNLDSLEESVKSNTYSKKINIGVMKIRDAIQRLLESNIEDAYEVGILETERFTSEVTVTYDKSHKVGGLSFKLDNNIVSKENAKLNNERSSLGGLKFDFNHAVSVNKESVNNQLKINGNLNNAQNQVQTAKNTKETNTQRLGQRPQVEYYYETISVERGGFFGGLMDFFSEKTERVRRSDQSAQREYDRKIEGIQAQYNSQIKSLNSKKLRLQSQLNQEKASHEVSEVELERIQTKISRQEDRIKDIADHIDSKLRNHRQQVTKEKRSELSSQVKNALHSEALNILTKKLKSALAQEIQLVSEKLKYYHKLKFDLYRQRLDLLDGKVKNLNLSQLKIADKEIKKLKKDVTNIKAFKS